MNKQKILTPFILIFLILTAFEKGNSQTIFTKVTDPLNAISTHLAFTAYTGATWIDYDVDGDLDLFVSPSTLYRNDGGGIFSIISNSGINFSQGLGNGNTWADYDNDGDVDMARVSSQSAVFENQGSVFERHMDGPFESFFYRGWSAAWGDYDQDGFVDLLMVHPQGFLGPQQKNRLFHNNGDGRFTEIFNDVTTDFSAYTGATWTDFDLDGDQDIFIGSGYVSSLTTDDIFLNLLSETGTASLVRMDTGVLATDLRDGQNWNWIDYDNDGDLDGYVTNYNTTKTNDFYRNDGNYSFHKLSVAEVGDIVNQIGPGLGNLWGDFDNDGDLDCFVTFDGGFDRYYQNDNGMFTNQSNGLQKSGGSRGASAGDYNEDGFLDVFVSSAAQSSVGLYHNDGNLNNWIELKLTGTVSNRSAIGAKIRLLSDIKGVPTWQIREINSQSSFCGSNSLVVHFGLDTTSAIDSLVIYWPSGSIQGLGAQVVNQILNISEPYPNGFLRANFRGSEIKGIDSLRVDFLDWSVADPSDPIVSYSWDLDGDGLEDATISNPNWLYGLDDSVYTVQLIVTNQSGTSDTITRQNYIRVDSNSISGLEDGSLWDFKVFPNPVQDQLNIKISLETQPQIHVMDPLGRTIYSAIIEEKSTLETSDWPSGIYLIKVTGAKSHKIKRVIKN